MNTENTEGKTDTNVAISQPADDDRKRNFNEMSILAPLLAGYTILYLTLVLIDFWLKERVELPEGMNIVYLALLGAYAADKEIRRWVGAAEASRRGSIFVYLWLIIFAVCYVISVFEPSYVVPDYLVGVTLQVLGIFFGTKASKQIYSWRVLKDESTITTKEDKILNLLKERGKITNTMVSELLGVSRNTASRLLGKLEAEGKVKKVGRDIGRGTYYVLC